MFVVTVVDNVTDVVAGIEPDVPYSVPCTKNVSLGEEAISETRLVK